MAVHPDERRTNNRLSVLLDEAAKQFASKGYRGTTMRAISKNINMLPGSVYYHFKSKEALLLAVYEVGVHTITETVNEAIDSQEEPWDKLEAAVTAHLKGVLDKNNYARIIINILPSEVEDLEEKLTELRDQYEDIFVNLIDALPLNHAVNRTMFRLMLLGAINWAQVWYRPDTENPEKIATTFIHFMRNSADNKIN